MTVKIVAVLFDPAIQVSIYNERLAIVLGILTLVLALATFASCRSCMVFLNRFGLGSFTRRKGYQTFYKTHAYLWWTLWFVLAMHVMVGVMHAASSIPGDSDAYVHWRVIWSGLGGLVLVGGFVLTSCRSFTHALDFTINRSSLKNRVYRVFNRYHSYYWLIFLLIAAGHFVLGYLHAGVWP